MGPGTRDRGPEFRLRERVGLRRGVDDRQRQSVAHAHRRFRSLVPCPWSLRNEKPRAWRGSVVLLAICRLPGNYADGATRFRTVGLELDLAVHQREQRVVAAQADARARMELGAALAHDDVAGRNRLAAIELHAQVFRVGIAAVARGTYAFLVCHDICLWILFARGRLPGNSGDLDLGVVLPVAHLLAMVLAAAELDDPHLVVAAVRAHLGGHAGAGDVGRTDGDVLAVADHQHLLELDRGVHVRIELLDAQDVALHHAELASAGNNDCVHFEDLVGSVVILVQHSARLARTERGSIARPCPPGNRAGFGAGGFETGLSATYQTGWYSSGLSPRNPRDPWTRSASAARARTISRTLTWSCPATG